MYTQCPECLSVFSLDARALSMAHGHVICGHCQAGFDSVATLAEQLPPEPFFELPVNEPALEPPLLDLVVYRPPPPPAAAVVMPEEPAATPGTPADFSSLAIAPRFARKNSSRKVILKKVRAPSPVGERRWPWVLACVVLTLLLAGQLAWAERDALISSPRIGAWLRSSCAMLRCQLPLVAAPQSIQLLASNVQAHPKVAGALIISAKIRNAAAFDQPWPVITITLSNVQGRRVGMRRLRPQEYLDDRVALTRGFAGGGSAVVVLEVADPGENAVDFAFSFE